VARIAGPARTRGHVSGDTALGEDRLWLDSLDLFEVILACEEEFGVRIGADATTVAEALRTVRDLAELISARHRTDPGTPPPRGPA
jgi:acyl carrier protein